MRQRDLARLKWSNEIECGTLAGSSARTREFVLLICLGVQVLP
jgi:hypothetical protein